MFITTLPTLPVLQGLILSLGNIIRKAKPSCSPCTARRVSAENLERRRVEVAAELVTDHFSISDLDA